MTSISRKKVKRKKWGGGSGYPVRLRTAVIDQHKSWSRVYDTWSFFEAQWKPKKWLRQVRVVYVRQRSTQRQNGPVQLEILSR